MMRTITHALFFITITFSFSNAFLGQVLFAKTWKETSVKDFSDNTLDGLVVTNLNGGEVELRPQLVKTQEDSQVLYIERFVAWDSSRTHYRKSWVTDNRLVVQKLDANGSPLENPITVNDPNSVVHQNSKSRVAISPDHYMVVWKNNEDRQLYGQLFEINGSRVGTNIKLVEENNSGDCPVVIYNNFLGSFDVYFHQGNFDDGTKIFLQRYDINANQIYFAELNGEAITKYELINSAKQDDNGDVVVTWTGSNAGYSSDNDIYARKYDFYGSPLTPVFKVNNDAGKDDQAESFVCFDDSSNFLITWMDMRDNVSEVGPYDYNIFGQFFTSDCQKVGRNFMVNTPRNSEDREPEIRFKDGEFEISWMSWNAERKIYELFLNKWNLSTIYSGTMLSSIFDAGSEGVIYREIHSESFIPDSASITFQIRSAAAIDEIGTAEWFGPTQGDRVYTAKPYEKINPIHNGDRFIQYRTNFQISRITQNPALESVTFVYSTSDTIPPSNPSNFTATGGHSQIVLSWDQNTESDLSHYLLYRGTDEGVFDSTWTKILGKDEIGFTDTSAVTGTNYFYALSAVDSTHNESVSSLASATPYAINIYVQAGAPAGDGTLSRPFTTIAEGQIVAQYGDTLVILPGIYEEAVRMKRGVSIVGTNANTTEIRGSDEWAIIYAADDAVIKNLSIVRTYSNVQDVIRCDKTSPAITSNIIVNYVQGSETGIGISVESGSPDISGNIIKGFTAGISSVNYHLPVSLNISNNIIITDGISIECYGDFGSTIINNTILEKSICLRTRNSKKLTIKNNIFYGSGSANTLWIRSRYSTIQSDYNCFWNVSRDEDDYSSGEHDFISDPLFTSIEKQDFSLRPDSPCINRGDPDSVFNDTDGTRNDIGAFGGPRPNTVALKNSLLKSVGINGFSGFPGDTVSTSIWIDEPAGLHSFEFLIRYRSDLLEFVEVDPEDENDLNLFVSLTPDGNEIILKLKGIYKKSAKKSRIVDIIFVVNQAAKATEATALSFENLSLWDENADNIKLKSISDGTFVVSRGDKDGRYLFVDSHGEAEGDGSQYRPFKTIQEALLRATAGDTIIVAAGEYSGRITMKDSVCVKGAGALVTTFYAPAEMQEYGIVFRNVKESEISGFRFKALNDEIVFEPVITCIASSPKISKNIFEFNNEPMPVISCEGTSSPQILGNIFKNRGIAVQHSTPSISANSFFVRYATSINCSDDSAPIIIGNKFFDNIDECISIVRSTANITANRFFMGAHGARAIRLLDASSTEIKNNIIEGLQNDASGIGINNSSDFLIANNTINTKGRGIEESLSSGRIYNNIIIGNRGFGIHYSQSTEANYNNLWNNILNYYQCEEGTFDISADPLFGDIENSNYQLSPNSPCIDRGHPDQEFNDPDGTRGDIGAFGGPNAYLLSDFMNEARLEIPSCSVPPKDTLELALLGKGIQGLANVEMSLKFDASALKFINAKTTEATRTFAVTKSIIDSNNVAISLFSPVGVIEDSTTIIKLCFETQNVNDIETRVDVTHLKLKDDVSNDLEIGAVVTGVISINPTGVDKDAYSPGTVPREFCLFQNFPNPFNGGTTIQIHVPQKGHISLRVYNVLGREVSVLMNKSIEAGYHNIHWDGKDQNRFDLPSGLYFVRMKAGAYEKTIKVVMVK